MTFVEQAVKGLMIHNYRQIEEELTDVERGILVHTVKFDASVAHDMAVKGYLEPYGADNYGTTEKGTRAAGIITWWFLYANFPGGVNAV